MANNPGSAEPGATSRPSSPNTRVPASNENRAVPTAAARDDAASAYPPPSVDPNVSSSTASKRAVKPAFTSALQMVPDEAMTSTLDKSYATPSPSRRSKACTMGRAKASPTITIRVARSRSATRHNSNGSNLRPSNNTTAPPASNANMVPPHMPVPCINGEHGIDTNRPHPTRAATNAATSSTDVGAATPTPAKAELRYRPAAKSCWRYITPFGIPVVPPV